MFLQSAVLDVHVLANIKHAHLRYWPVNCGTSLVPRLYMHKLAAVHCLFHQFRESSEQQSVGYLQV